MEVNFILEVLEIALLDLALCGDNVGVIALATRNLPKKYERLASLIGITGAILLRIYFAICVSFFLKIDKVPLKLFGGIILIKVTWDLIVPDKKEKEKEVKESEKFWDAVLAVIIADISMSLDNVLAIAGAANGDMLLIMAGIALNIPIIFFGSQFVVNMMRKFPIVIYAGAAILAYTSINMITEDTLFMKYIKLPYAIDIFIPFIAGAMTILYGLYMIYFCNKINN
ncbi:YjbE family putative metal transport protein [Clostridium sp. 19966]|uniref:YjbE family putative metal transport protein n=1 Tax=Clostridium sp. 19966 TaxID=2768166 RepID=UPI0028DE83C0|nr:YjbE family putative metal transport protein [Clostridium sp. 19966]MDT8717195.1 YjbE family putative metal transport protein [Clostridium sp. 19966]